MNRRLISTLGIHQESDAFFFLVDAVVAYVADNTLSRFCVDGRRMHDDACENPCET